MRLERWMRVLALPVVGAASLWGCLQVANPDVIGPHGEHLIELQCPTPDMCMDFARQTCGGDFDTLPHSGPSQYMLVHCLNTRGAPADAGR